MKRAFILLLFVIALPKFSYCQVQPEFQLNFNFADTTQDDGIETRAGRAIGYDPFASDGYNRYDSIYGEVPDYPGGFGMGSDFWFTRTDGSATETLIDILHKPLTDSFALNYSMGLSFQQYPGSITWDSSRIPYFINGIWIRTAFDTMPLVDMKKTNFFSVPNPSTGVTWGIQNLIVTIFYNMEPRFVPSAVTSSGTSEGGGLILSANIFPNPMLSRGALSLSLASAANISIAGYDALGREVLSVTKNDPAGESQVDLSALANARGAIMLRLDATSGATHETKTVMLVKE